VHDDGFAHSFADNGAAFNLIVHGLDEEFKEAGMPITVTLASFHDNRLDISSDWKWVNLSSLGQVNAIYFTLESSDQSGALGMNTAAFFCLGGMEILEHVDEIPRPAGLEAEPLDENRVKVKWSKVYDAAYYRLYVDSVLVDSTTATNYTFSNLDIYTSYCFFVQAVSAFGESSEWGYVTARTKDLTPPTPPTNLRVTEKGLYKIVLAWDAGTDNIAVEKYAVYVNGKKYSRPKYTTVSITGLDPSTTYMIEVETLDSSGNASERASIQATTLSDASAMEQPSADTRKTVYTLSGQPVANAPTGQVHIVQSGNTTSKQIKQ
jgi:chitodextrinase